MSLTSSYTHGADKSEELKTIQSKTLAPKVVRRFDKQTSDKYDVIVGKGMIITVDTAKAEQRPEYMRE